MRIALIFVLAAAACAQPLQLTYTGTAGWQITDGKTVILVDPYFTRAKYRSPNDDVSPDDPRPLVNGASVVEPDTAVIDAHVKRADYILLTHTHPDHSLDMPYIARKTGSPGDRDGEHRLSGASQRRGRGPYSGGEGRRRLEFNGFSVRVIASLHGIFSKPRPGAPTPVPPLFPADAKPPIRFAQHVEGGTLAYLIRIASHQIILFGSMNYIESELAGCRPDIRPDIALIGAMPGRNNIAGLHAAIDARRWATRRWCCPPTGTASTSAMRFRNNPRLTGLQEFPRRGEGGFARDAHRRSGILPADLDSPAW